MRGVRFILSTISKTRYDEVPTRPSDESHHHRKTIRRTLGKSRIIYRQFSQRTGPPFPLLQKLAKAKTTALKKKRPTNVTLSLWQFRATCFATHCETSCTKHCTSVHTWQQARVTAQQSGKLLEIVPESRTVFYFPLRFLQLPQRLFSRCRFIQQ